MSAFKIEPSSFDFDVVQAALRKLVEEDPTIDPKLRARELMKTFSPSTAVSDELIDALVLDLSVTCPRSKE